MTTQRTIWSSACAAPSSRRSRRVPRARFRSRKSPWQKNPCSARSRRERPSSRRSSFRRRATSCSARSRRQRIIDGQTATMLADQANVDAQLAEATAREHNSHQAEMELEASLQALRQEASMSRPPPPPAPVPCRPSTPYAIIKGGIMSQKYLTGAALCLALGACATAPQPNAALETARAQVAAAEADPNVAQYDALDLQAARQDLAAPKRQPTTIDERDAISLHISRRRPRVSPRREPQPKRTTRGSRKGRPNATASRRRRVRARPTSRWRSETRHWSSATRPRRKAPSCKPRSSS